MQLCQFSWHELRQHEDVAPLKWSPKNDRSGRHVSEQHHLPGTMFLVFKGRRHSALPRIIQLLRCPFSALDILPWENEPIKPDDTLLVKKQKYTQTFKLKTQATDSQLITPKMFRFITWKTADCPAFGTVLTFRSKLFDYFLLTPYPP